MYNFKNPEIKKKVAWRLFVKYKKNSHWFKTVGKQKTYNGYFCRADKGRGKLMTIFLDRYDDIFYAVLYNEVTGDKFHQKKIIAKVLKNEEKNA